MTTRRVVIDNSIDYHVPSPKLTRLTPQQMDEIRENGLCFNYENNYNKGHKCGENK
jgi:hypothetical protein